MPRRFAPAAAFAVLAACNAPPALDGVAGITIASADAVAACTPTVRVTTTLPVYGALGREQALGIARNQTMSDALAKGSDTIVFLAGGPDDPDALFVEGQGYRC